MGRYAGGLALSSKPPVSVRGNRRVAPHMRRRSGLPLVVASARPARALQLHPLRSRAAQKLRPAFH